MDKSQANLNAHVDAITDGDLTNVAQNQDILNELNTQLTQNTTAKDTQVFLTENTTNKQGEFVQGLANPTKGHTYLDIDHLDNAIETLNHEIAHHNGLGETSATRMGKLGNLAYNIGTSLNKEDINTHRQGITPTTQTLQNLSTDEQLAHHTNNQAILDENKEQLEGEMESDGVWGYDGDYRGKSNEQLAKETREFMSDEEALVIKEVFSIALPALDSLELANAYKNAKTDAEKQAVLASALQIPVNKAGKVLKAVKSGKKANIQKEVKAVQAEQRKATQTKTTCTTGTVCFTAGTLIETSEGLKAIETFTGGELIWTRNDVALEYGYRPVIATKATPDQPIFQVTVKNHQGQTETLHTTAEHPFWIKDKGWLKASLLEQGMILLDRNNQEVEVLSQFLIPNHTVYNIEVDDFHTYHVGKVGVWMHNDGCCGVSVGGWGKGSYDDSMASLQAHFNKHGAEVGAVNVEQYLRKAEAFKQNLRGATKSPVPGQTNGVVRYKKNGKYIDIAPDGSIISFGKQ